MPEKKDFIIKDKRMFSEEGQDHQEEERAAKEEERAESSEEEAQAPDSEDAAASGEDAESFQLPEINFATFIFSLNSSVLAHLGIIDDPASGKKVKNLALAKQTIDILGMLEEKTRGNLTEDEESMLKNILYDLRMIYVKEKG
ncbi:MAG: DUF1844 domain-containing protein [Candidatus Desulfatibia sp.]|uniref:DUF1844 domain-containing protein n=1 Tax=Candidatus Desulfatibia sp. TaxID=3101189 RepID=UPI002F31FB82